MKLLKLSFYTLFLLVPLLGKAQECTGSLCGTVTGGETKEPIAYAGIFIEELGVGDVTDDEGKFHIHNLCNGTYTVSATHIGCVHLAKKVSINGDNEVSFELMHEVIELKEVLVKETSILPNDLQSQQELSGRNLAAARGKTLGEALENLPGLNVVSTGGNAVKPVIHGMHSNRVLLLNNGVRQEGQQWGLDHGEEIDPNVAGKITVVMGANSVRYGAGALGGVILVEPKPLRSEAGMGGEVSLAGFSNGRMGMAAASLDGKLKGKLPVSGRLQGTLKRGGNLRTPGYFLENTGSEERDFSAAAGLKKERFETNLFYSDYFTKTALLEGAPTGNLDDLLAAIEQGQPADEGSFTYALGGPLQQVNHRLLKSETTVKTGQAGHLSFQYARQYDRRKEFEEEQGTIDFQAPGARFDLTSHTADATWEHKPWKHLQGALGAQYMQLASTTPAGGLIPDYNSRTFGVFWLERWRNYPAPLELEAGIRYDTRRIYVERREAEIIDKTLHYNNLSGTIGLLYKTARHFDIKLSSGTAWRSPSVNELYSDGVHEGTASYEIGRDDLVPEREYSTSLTFDFENKDGFSAGLSFYHNFVDNFIYLAPLPEPVVNEQGAFPAFQYEQANAAFTGLDWNARWQPAPSVALGSEFSWLRATNRTAGEPLVFMPANSLRHSLTYFFGNKERQEEAPFVRLTMENVLKQHRVPANQDFAPAPDGYTLFGAEASATLHLGGQPLHVGLGVQNIFNTAYRDYLNRLRYFAHQPGRNISVRVNYIF